MAFLREDHHYSQWFPVIHYGSLSRLQAFNISLMQPLMLASGKDQALRAWSKASRTDWKGPQFSMNTIVTGFLGKICNLHPLLRAHANRISPLESKTIDVTTGLRQLLREILRRGMSAAKNVQELKPLPEDLKVYRQARWFVQPLCISRCIESETKYSEKRHLVT